MIVYEQTFNKKNKIEILGIIVYKIQYVCFVLIILIEIYFF